MLTLAPLAVLLRSMDRVPAQGVTVRRQQWHLITDEDARDDNTRLTHVAKFAKRRWRSAQLHFARFGIPSTTTGASNTATESHVVLGRWEISSSGSTTAIADGQGVVMRGQSVVSSRLVRLAMYIAMIPKYSTYRLSSTEERD